MYVCWSTRLCRGSDRYYPARTRLRSAVAAACRVTNQKVAGESITFDTVGQAQTNAVVVEHVAAEAKR